MPYAKPPVPAGHDAPKAQNWGGAERQVFGAAASMGPVDVLAPFGSVGAHADQFLGGRLGSGQLQKVRLKRPAQSKDRPLLLSILTQASSGDQVRRLQQLLNGRSEPSPGLQDSGIFDSKTLDALLSFQRAAGLPADGKVGKNTWTSLLFGDKQRLPMQAPVNAAQSPHGLVNTSKSGIPSWSLKSKFEAVLKNTAPKLPGDLRFTFEQLVSPSHRKSMAQTLVSWAVSHAAQTGEVTDCGLFLINLGFSSLDAFDVVDDLNDLLGRTANATDEMHLEDAEAQLARVISAVGVTLFAQMMERIHVKSLTRKAVGAGGGAAVPPAKPAPGRTSARVSSGGGAEAMAASGGGAVASAPAKPAPKPATKTSDEKTVTRQTAAMIKAREAAAAFVEVCP
jgi:hypothetical protein